MTLNPTGNDEWPIKDDDKRIVVIAASFFNDRLTLTPAEERVINTIALFHNHLNQNGCWPSLRTIARLTGFSRFTVSRINQRLEALGWLKKKRLGKYMTYQLNVDDRGALLGQFEKRDRSVLDAIIQRQQRQSDHWKVDDGDNDEKNEDVEPVAAGGKGTDDPTRNTSLTRGSNKRLIEDIKERYKVYCLDSESLDALLIDNYSPPFGDEGWGVALPISNRALAGLDGESHIRANILDIFHKHPGDYSKDYQHKLLVDYQESLPRLLRRLQSDQVAKQKKAVVARGRVSAAPEE